jgi:hypothetical protein
MDLHTLTSASFATDDDVRTLLAAFHDRTLPRSAWNHRAHMTVALAVGRAEGPDAALDAMRRAIHAFNDAIGIVSTPDYGYHETVTAFFMHAAALHMMRHPEPVAPAADANAFMAEWGAPDLPLRFYSRERLFSREARLQWLAPDLAPLPGM